MAGSILPASYRNAPSDSRPTVANFRRGRSMTTSLPSGYLPSSKQVSLSHHLTGGTNRTERGRLLHKYYKLDRLTESHQISSTLYFLRVVMRVVVTSVTIVPKSSRSDSAC